jgi:hypothetical protein
MGRLICGDTLNKGGILSFHSVGLGMIDYAGVVKTQLDIQKIDGLPKAP